MKTRILVIGLLAGSIAGLPQLGSAQVTDVLNAIDSGTRAMGMGGGTAVSGSDTTSALSNPAGLGLVDRGQFGMAIRNLPETTTTVENDFRDPTTRSTATSGGRAATHMGLVMPWKSGSGKHRGSFGLSYTTAGFLRDLRSGNNLTDGDLRVQNYSELTKVKVDLFTLGYGTSNGSGLSWGIGLVMASVGVENLLRYNLQDAAGNDRGNVSVDNSQIGTGFGGVVGVQFQPKGNSNMVIGASYRTAIDLSGNDRTSAIYDRVPAKASLGMAGSRSGFRGGRDFLVYGLQIDSYFDGRSGGAAATDDAISFGGGFEYNYHWSNYRIPLRLGFNTVNISNDGGNRNTFTVGFGVRPLSSNVSFDLNFASPSRGGAWDLGLGVTYRFGK